MYAILTILKLYFSFKPFPIVKVICLFDTNTYFYLHFKTIIKNYVFIACKYITKLKILV